VNLIEDHPECHPLIYPTSVYGLYLRDMDGDDDLDIAVSCEYEYAEFCGGEARIGIGIGYFENEENRQIPDETKWIRMVPNEPGVYWEPFDVADLNGDSNPDALYQVAGLEVRLLAGTEDGPWSDGPVDGVGNGNPLLVDCNGDGEADVVKKTTFTYQIYRGNGSGGFDWIQSIPQAPLWPAFPEVDGVPGVELLGIRPSPSRLLVLPNLASSAAGVSDSSIEIGAQLQVFPSVAHGSEIRVRLEGVVAGGRGGVAARVIDVSGAERATLWLRSASGGAMKGCCRRRLRGRGRGCVGWRRRGASRGRRALRSSSSRVGSGFSPPLLA